MLLHKLSQKGKQDCRIGEIVCTVIAEMELGWAELQAQS